MIILKRNLLFFLVIFSGLLNAQTQNALLWEIHKKGMEKPSFIFGTIHYICPEDFIMNEIIEESFKKTDNLIMMIPN